jgi:transcriptional regulator with XRE-family HTH domain
MLSHLGKTVNAKWEVFQGAFLSVFSDRLRTLRGELKQAEFARKVGIAQNTYSRYESGERVPDIEVLARLAARLGVSADWLLGLDSEDAISTTAALPDQNAKPCEPVAAAYCPACGQKDVTIASQAESIVNLTRSLAALANLRA